MNDMLTDTMSDDAVIGRLRSALDEVATTGGPITADAPDESDASVVPLRTASPGRRPARAPRGSARSRPAAPPRPRRPRPRRRALPSGWTL